MIDSVYVGITSYGMTTAVLNEFDVLSKKVYQTSMIVPCSYMDGDCHHLVAATETYVKKVSNV